MGSTFTIHNLPKRSIIHPISMNSVRLYFDKFFFFTEMTTELNTPTISITSNHPVTITDSTPSTTTMNLKLLETTVSDDKRNQAKETAHIISFIGVATVGGVTEISILMIVIVLLAVLVNKTRDRRARRREYPYKSGDELAYQQTSF